MSNQMKQLLPTFPFIDNMNFYTEIYNKYEFNQESTEHEEFLRYYQVFVSRYISSHTPYSGILLYHEMGRGKTRTIVATAEDLFDTDKRFERVYMSVPNDLHVRNIKKEILKKYKPTIEKYRDNMSDFKDKYHIDTHKKFIFNLLNKRQEEFKDMTLKDIKTHIDNKHSEIIKQLQNSLIVIDEVHHLRIKKTVDEKDKPVEKKMNFLCVSI